jgi:20S proteasome subunit alpha 4
MDVHSYPQQLLLQVREYLEKNYTESSGEGAIKLCVKSLMEMIEASGQTIEVMVMRQDGLTILSQDEVDAVVKQIEADTAQSDCRRRTCTTAIGGLH